MDCNYTTIKTCELKGSTFRSHVLNFGDFDISDYEFTTDFANSFGQKISTETLEKLGNTVILTLNSIENKSGKILADVWMEKDGKQDLAVRFDISISDTDCGCTDDMTHDITITYQELVIPVAVTQAVVNINLDFDSLTPDQILELQQPAIDAGNEVRQQVDEYIDAKDLQINSVINEANDATQSANTAAGNAQSEANDANDINNAVQLAENTRISNETTRQNQESTRQTNETTRVNNESGRVTAENSRVSAESMRVSAENARILAEQNRQGRELVAAVTLNNSFEIKIQSIDYATGIFTTTAPHGLTSGSRLSPMLDLNSGVNFPPAVLPDGLPPASYSGGLIIHDTTRFSINGVTMTSHAGVDFSKWHFENANSANNISLTGLNADYYEVEILGRILSNISYLTMNTNRVNLSSSLEHLVGSGASGSAIALSRSTFLAFSAHVYYSGRITIDGRNGLIVRQEVEAIGSQTGTNAKTQNVYYTDKRITLDSRMTSGSTQILAIGTGTGTGFANGTKVFLYKRK